MTYAELKIDVICEMTGDARGLVAEVVSMMQKVLEAMGVDHAFMNEQIPAQDLARARQKLFEDKELVTWYKKGLHYYHTVNQQGGMQ